MKQFHIYGLGAALVDTEIQVTDEELGTMGVEKGLMTLVDEARQGELLDHLEGHLVHSKRASGGSACNSVIAASYFGADVFFSCRVADDDNGHFYLADLQRAGVTTDPHDGTAGITGKCLVMISPDAERSMNTYLGISETFSVSDLNLAAIADSQYIYIEGYLVTSGCSREAAIVARQHAEQSGVKTALSLSDPGIVNFFRDGLAAMIGNKVDLLFCNEAEATGWAQTDSLDEAVESLKSIARSFAITRGERGALVYDGSQVLTIQAAAVTAIDTNGAGDMFAGAFLYAITHGHDYATAGRLAALAAGAVVADYGPRLPAGRHRELLRKVIGK